MFIAENEKEYIVENEVETGCFINRPIEGKIKINKTSKDGVLKGFTFIVKGTTFDGQQYEERFITNENGEIFIEGLRLGQYTIYEESNENNKRYILPKQQSVKIEDEDTIELEFYNDLIEVETPKTRRYKKYLTSCNYFYYFTNSTCSISCYKIKK